MRVVNIIDGLNKKNFGVWNSATAFDEDLLAYGIESELWYPKSRDNYKANLNCDVRELNSTSKTYLKNLIENYLYSKNETIFVSHGCWRYPTQWGAYLASIGYKWIYAPHGMLEPWSLIQKKLKKELYWKCFEYRYAKRATAVRAVSLIEQDNLSKTFSNVIHVPNCVKRIDANLYASKHQGVYVFLGRLHHGKSIIPLVEAWQKSVLSKRESVKLIIAGPDDGEFGKLNKILKGYNGNIEYIGPVYGEEKSKLLSQATFFILPSVNEGFSTTILEAMQFGVIPIISDGCNFPELLKKQFCLNSGLDVDSISSALNHTHVLSMDSLDSYKEDILRFVNNNYCTNIVVKDIYRIYQDILNN